MIPTKCPLLVLLLASAASASLSPQAHAASLQTIYRFAGGSDGAYPQAGVAADSAGNLYGTTTSGGGGAGTVYRLSPPALAGGEWTEQILHSFLYATDGSGPEAPVTLDGSGNIYGTALANGVNGGGTVFKLDASANWAITVLYSFSETAPNPASPETGLIFGPGGLLYGSTEFGGLGSQTNFGVSYSVSPAGGSPNFSVIHTSCTRRMCAARPGGLIVNRAGQLFGVTGGGGSFGSGIAFSMTLRADGKWNFHDLHDFGGPGDVTWTRNPLLLGVKGLAPGLYGCGPGGAHAQGAVYRLTPPSPPGSGQWTESILYQFGSKPNDPNPGGNQQCGLAQDLSSGKLYGITGAGGTHAQGTVFELDPPVKLGAPWTETVLYSFTGLADAAIPWGTPIFVQGRLYGVTFAGDPHAKAPYGTVWEYKP